LASLPVFVCLTSDVHAEVTIEGTRWFINGKPTSAGTPCDGLLMNVRMVNATFEDRSRPEFDAEKNTDEFIATIADYAGHGVNAVTLCLQGGMPGYEGAVNSAFEPDGSLRADYLRRVEKVIRACDERGVVVVDALEALRGDAHLRHRSIRRLDHRELPPEGQDHLGRPEEGRGVDHVGGVQPLELLVQRALHRRVGVVPRALGSDHDAQVQRRVLEQFAQTQ